MTGTVAATEQDRDLLQDTVRGALKELSPSADVRRAMATADGYDPGTWQRLAAELGLPGLTLPEEYGGAGLTEAELAIAFEEAGAALLCAPLLSTAGLAVPLLQALGALLPGVGAALDRYAPAIASGELTATVALAEDAGRWATGAVSCAGATGRSAQSVVTGVKNFVVDGATAGLILVVAATGDGLGVFAVERDAPGVTRERLVTLDQTRKQARLTFDETPATRIGAGDATAAVTRATAVSRALLAAEQGGGAKRCLDVTVRYAQDRIQFGRPIGSFQAVKQRLAEMLIQAESGRSAAYAAADAAAAGAEDLEHVAAIAALTCGDAYKYIAAQTVQLHGGIGFTWDHDAHLYFKRARASAVLLGTAAELTDEIAADL
jgi:acyl-CoA dehydrogenase